MKVDDNLEFYSNIKLRLGISLSADKDDENNITSKKNLKTYLSKQAFPT